MTVSPSAVTACQKAAESRSITPATAPAPSRIRVVSDGLAMSRPVSAAVPLRDPDSDSKVAVTSDLTTSTATSAASNVGQSVEQGIEVELHPHRDQEDAEREPAQRRGDEFDLGAIVGLGDEHPGDERAEDRAEADRAGGEAGEDDDEQADREEQLGALGPRRLREQMRAGGGARR